MDINVTFFLILIALHTFISGYLDTVKLVPMKYSIMVSVQNTRVLRKPEAATGDFL